MTGNDVSKIVRPDINDYESPYTWVAADFIRLINAGVKDITKRRPDALLDTSNALITVANIGALGGTISIANKWLEPLAFFVSSRCMKMHAGEKEKREKAAEFWQSYIDEVSR